MECRLICSMQLKTWWVGGWMWLITMSYWERNEIFPWGYRGETGISSECTFLQIFSWNSIEKSFQKTSFFRQFLVYGALWKFVKGIFEKVQRHWYTQSTFDHYGTNGFHNLLRFPLNVVGHVDEPELKAKPMMFWWIFRFVPFNDLVIRLCVCQAFAVKEMNAKFKIYGSVYCTNMPFANSVKSWTYNVFAFWLNA